MATTIETTGLVTRVSEGRDLQPSSYYPEGRTAFDVTMRYPRAYQAHDGSYVLGRSFHKATLYVRGQQQPSPIQSGMLIAATLRFSSFPSRENDNEVYAQCSIEAWRGIEWADF